MDTKFKKFFLVLLFTLFSSQLIYAQALPSRETIEVAKGVYADVGFVSNNMGFIVTDEGVAVVDTGTKPDIGKEFLSSIRKITQKPIKYIIYTHYHYDHTSGAAALKEKGTVVIAHENLVKNFETMVKLEEINQTLIGSKVETSLIYPDITYKDDYTINLGGKIIKLIHVDAETDDATLVCLPDDKVLFIGDMTNSNLGSPVMPEGYPGGLIEAIDMIDNLDIDTFVPGHGLIEHTNKESLHALKKVTQYLMDEIKKCADMGYNLEETQAAITMPVEFTDDKALSDTFLHCREQYVNRLHKNYTGYYGKDPIKFSPAPKKERSALIEKMAGGEKELLETAEMLIKKQQYQLALEILDIVTTNHPENKKAHSFKEESFYGLAGMTKYNWHKMVSYMNAAKKEHELAGEI